jgi:sodium-dependent dicarboxylate transporter 2/3/5
MKRGEWIGALLGVILLAIFLLLPPIEPLTPMGMKVVGIFLFTVIWWATIGIGYPSLISIALLGVTGVMTVTQAFAASLGDWLIFFLIGVMGLGAGLRVTGFSRRFAVWFMSLPFTKGRPWMLVAMLLLSCSLLGMVMSLTANCIIFMAIVGPMLEEMGYKRGDRFAAMVMMGIGWASTSSFVYTPIASVGNLMTIDWIMRDMGYSVSFAQWFAWGLPMGLLVYLILLANYRYMVRPDVKQINEMSEKFITRAKSEMGSMKREEKIAVGIFLVVIVVWMLPDIFRTSIPGLSTTLLSIGRAVPAFLGACVLCFITVKGKPVLNFNQWMREHTEWGTVMLVAAIQVIGGIIGKPETGIPQLLTDIFKPIAMGTPGIIFVLITLAWVILQTNIMSNLVSMTLVYTIMIPVAASTGAANPIALAVMIAACSNLAFALPSATTSTALVVGSGWVPVPFLAKYGWPLSIPLILAFAFIAYPYANLIFR